MSLLISGVSRQFNLDKGRTVQALKGIDLAVAPGEFICLLGGSGCCVCASICITYFFRYLHRAAFLSCLKNRDTCEMKLVNILFVKSVLSFCVCKSRATISS